MSDRLRDSARLVIAVVVAVAVTAASPPARSTHEPRRFTIAAAGDILVHGRVADLAAVAADGAGWDFTPMLAAIEPWVASADFAICHLEGTISSTNTGLSYYPRFVAPRQIADAIATGGWDACSTANNHGLDAGYDGIVATLDELDARGIGHTGTARTPEERRPSLYEVSGVRIAHLAFSQHFNGLAPPADKPWAANTIDVDTILEYARWARDQGAEFVVLSLSWGAEYTVDPTGYQRSVATDLLTDGAIDLIIGHHAHVVQPIDVIDGRYVVYGMGNHLSNQNVRWGPQYYATEDGLLVIAHVVESPNGGFVTESIEVVPTWVRFDDLTVLPAQDALSQGYGPPGALTTSIERTWARASLLGAPITLAADPHPAVACDGRRASILGTSRDDVIEGTDGDDVIVAGAGDDRIRARDGDDLICAGPGDDIVDAGTGRDRVWGERGDDLLDGGSILDLLIGGPGVDTCGSRPIVAVCEVGR